MKATKQVLESRLKWMEENQPRNVGVINLLREKLGLPPKAGLCFAIEPWQHWRNRGASSN